MKYKFSPSLMCMDLLHVEEQIRKLNRHADYLHIDIMDGHYVKNFALSPAFVRQIRPIATLPLDVHLIMDHPEDYLQEALDAGADIITPLAEQLNPNVFGIISAIHQQGRKAGVSLNPATPLEHILSYAHLLDKLTIMTIEPGFAGQPFLQETLSKIAQAKELRDRYHFHYEIEIDGAGRQNTFSKLYQAGAEVFVVGASGLFTLDYDIDVAWEQMMQGFRMAIGC